MVLDMRKRDGIIIVTIIDIGGEMMKTVKYSRQRESIKNYLMSRKDHPTADMVYSALREVYPNISLGTVYRNLTFLAERGEIIKLSCGEGYDRFDAQVADHYHFICTDCHNVLDLDLPPIDHINVLASNGFEGEVNGHKTYFYGRCPDCMKKSGQDV